MNAYSKYLSLKVLSAIDRGMPRKEVVEVFGVSLATIKRWLKRRGEPGDVETGPLPGRPSMKGAALREWLPAQISANPTLTLAERYEAFREAAGHARFYRDDEPQHPTSAGQVATQKSPSRPRSATRKKILARWRISVQGPHCL
jgi:predicted component of type VI protein secretion system